MLTKKQRDLLLLIHQKLGEAGVPPSFDEMREALGLKSKSGVHRLITALVERGYLRRLPHKARALEITRLPEDMKSRLFRAPESVEKIIDKVPLYGKIAAGTPIEAIRNEGQTIAVPATLLGPGAFYALTVEGDSMIDAGIRNNDTVIVRKCETANAGDIVVALLDDLEVTLKRIGYEGDTILLKAENPAYPTRSYAAGRVRIQGTLAALMRTY